MEDFRNYKTISNAEYEEFIALKIDKSVSYKRHIAKAISYRVLGTLQTCTISYVFTGNFWVAGSIGLSEICIKPIIYFLHERVWYKWIKYGIKNKNKD